MQTMPARNRDAISAEWLRISRRGRVKSDDLGEYPPALLGVACMCCQEADEKLQGKQVGIASPLDRAAGSSLQGGAVGMEPARWGWSLLMR